ncbi:MAG: MotA/TolQ/ExbB proton channel family protein, partial [Arenicellales bacterium]
LDYRDLVHAVERNKDRHSEPSNLGAYLEQRVHAGHASGWFVADLMIKLGLLGTVVGFIFMLNSVAQMETTDLNAAKLMLTQMSSGMRIALFTTLAGLSSGLILGAQYQLLDRSADRLFRQIIRLIDTGSASENEPSGPA